jgi:Xaa-Pro aminopeptidase
VFIDEEDRTMKIDLDRLMEARGLDALLVTGASQNNPDMYYFTGGAHLTGGDLLKKRGANPVLFFNSMERDEAARTGLQTRPLDVFEYQKLLKEAGDLPARAYARRYQLMLVSVGFTRGRLGVYGQVPVGEYYAIFQELQNLLSEVEIVGEGSNSVLLKARATKDEQEIQRMREIGLVTTEVVGRVADFLSSQRGKDNVLVDKDGQPITIGAVKSRINLWLAEKGAENPEGTIFAIGRDAGVPHSVGKADDLLHLGQTIVFDIFPCEGGGGYYYDFTRTWCLGYAPDEVQALYSDVASVYRTIMDELKMGERCRPYQVRTCEIFESQGHPTVQSNPKTQEGYVHGLGHGLGLAVHEAPAFGAAATDEDRLEAGVVVTIEPGLYYPERGMGCRLEDSVWVRPDGQFEILAPYPHDLVLPVKQ